MALFVEVVKARSFRRAAETIGMPNSTLSRRISDLEKAIGLRLLHRTTRKIELTEAGQLYFERCKPIVDEARLAHEQLGEMVAQPSGVLRVSLPVDFATAFLAPKMAEFSRRYPGISFEFDLTPRRVDLVTEPIDVAIRMGELPDSSLIARQLAIIPRHLYASPRYLGMIRRLAALDLGIAMLAEEIVAEDLAGGRLRRVLPRWHAPPIPVYAITETRLLPAKTQRFIEFLRECLGRV